MSLINRGVALNLQTRDMKPAICGHVLKCDMYHKGYYMAKGRGSYPTKHRGSLSQPRGYSLSQGRCL